jgi:hypothetical protein
MAHELSIRIGENMPLEPKVLLVTSLGDNNRGIIGPDRDEATNAQITEYMADAVAKPEYSKRPTKTWMCVDGRVPADAIGAEATDEADPQTAGGLAITELSVEYMMNRQPLAVSLTLAQKTKKLIASGQDIVVHGDENSHKAGCGCNKSQREILRHNAANIDIVTPIAWELGKTVGLDEFLKVEDVTNLITVGQRSAENDDLWDVTPEEKVDIILANGGRYVEVAGEHREYITRIAKDVEAFDAAQFIRDNQDEHGNPLEAFSVSLGCLKKYYFDRAEVDGTSTYDAARQVMAAILHNGGTAKWLSNENMHAAVVGT